MKFVIYGASVTAQKGSTGYFERLEEIKPDSTELIRIPYGASHLQFAGIAMLQKVINEQPDVCILDWVTPSTKVFPEGVVDRVNNILLSNGIHPIWLLLPRTDDPDSERECCNQLRQSATELIDVISFNKSEYDESDLSKILRDVVHTNSLGAEKYSQFILNIIHNCIEKNINLQKSHKPINAPFVTQCEGVIKNDSKLHMEISVTESGNIATFIFARIGPKSPILEIVLTDSEGREEIAIKNVVDPWCYYERDMLLNMASFKNVAIGDYSITISMKDLNPFEAITTLKPIEEESKLKDNFKRFLKLKEMSVDGSVIIRNINYGI